MILQHPSRHVWDFWYYYQTEKDLYHVFFLNADRALVPEEQHHFHAQVGYAITEDFVSIEWIDDAVFSADPDGWDNTSIWTGDVVSVRGGYALFYTSRDGRKDDGMTQNIGLALSTDFRQWERVPGVQIEPDERWYEPRTVPGEKTIHAWRDPFPVSCAGREYLLVTAKNKQALLGRKGCVGLVRCIDSDLTRWEVLPPLWSPGLHDEIEVSQVYREDEHHLQLVYSTAPEPRTMCVRLNIEAGLENAVQIGSPRVLVSPEKNLYACRLIPELGGEIVGFDRLHGGLRRAGLRENWRPLERHLRARL